MHTQVALHTSTARTPFGCKIWGTCLLPPFGVLYDGWRSLIVVPGYGFQVQRGSNLRPMQHKYLFALLRFLLPQHLHGQWQVRLVLLCHICVMCCAYCVLIALFLLCPHYDSYVLLALISPSCSLYSLCLLLQVAWQPTDEP